ncbi:MAG: hypothetical protein BRD39_04145 [Bacteroidetes bacterium QH_9_64_21]|nr:MAG: hypothetical protein BRD39_04145 [Bacteroidetes bacterium QH_9_64_21]
MWGALASRNTISIGPFSDFPSLIRQAGRQDIDLLVVLDDDMMAGKASSRGVLYKRVARQLRDIERTVPLDLIVHSRSMHQAFLETDSMFARKMKREGEVLYESGN